MITLTREQVEGLIQAFDSNNGMLQHVAVIFLKSLLEEGKEK